MSPSARTRYPQGNWLLPKTQDTSWPELAVGREPLGQPGRAGSPGEPSKGLTPRLGQDTPSLAEAQIGSVYRMSALFPSPIHHFPWSPGGWEGAGGARGSLGGSPIPGRSLCPPPLLGSEGVPQPLFSNLLVSPSKHLKREICRRQLLFPRKV